jgi:cytochrome c oxidase subunit 3
MSVTPAADSISKSRERDLNGLYAIGMIATLAFVTVTFVALILVFILRSRVSLNWNPILLPSILWWDSLVLVASSVVYEIGHRKLRKNDQVGFFKWTRYSTGLGVLFLVGQLAAWGQIFAAGQLVQKNPHSSFFFIFSGMHAAHILVGLGGLVALLFRTREPASGPKWQMNTRVLANVVGIFWHYLDGLWIVLFALLLLIRR